MEREIVLEGNWWLPDKPKDNYTGTLRIAPDDGVNLEIAWKLELDLSTMEKEQMGRIHEEAVFGSIPEIIIGELFNTTLSRRDITLYKCNKNNETLSQDMCKTSYEVTYAFRGVQFLKPQDIQFNKISIDFSGLHDWVKISVFNQTYDSIKKKRVLEYDSHKEIPLAKTNEYEIVLEFPVKAPVSISTRSFVKREICYRQETKVAMYFTEKTNFLKCLELTYHIRDFLNLMVFKPIQIISMKAILNPPGQFLPVKIVETYSPLFSASGKRP